MKSSFAILLFALLPVFLRADSFSCTVDGQPSSCAAAGFQTGQISATYKEGAGSFDASGDFAVTGQLPVDSPIHFSTYKGSFDDTFYVPPAPKGDVFKVSIHATSVPGHPPYDGQDTGAASTIELRSNVIDFDPTYNVAYPGECHYRGCVFDGTIPADQITYLRFIGEIDAGVDRGGVVVNAGSVADITLDLYKADGVTPDVFTPEPTSFSLFGLSGLIGAVAYCKRRSHII